jgi:predicted dehydrogenase
MTKDFTRREFLHTTAGVAMAGVLSSRVALSEADSKESGSQAALASDANPAPVRFGIIGVGMQGSGLLKTSIGLPGVHCIAACDLYDGRHTLAREIAGQQIETTRRYRDLLANKTIEALIVAVPDHWHKQIVIDAVEAGKDVYCEKPMSHTIAEGEEMMLAVQKSGRIVQIGSQRVSSPLFAKAKGLYENGAIGELMQVELTIGRNTPTGAWEYPPPLDLSPINLDWETWLGTAPKKDFDPYTFARWRCWHQYGTGLAGDLMVHLISGMQFVTGINQAPDLVSSMGGIFRWKDGRNMPDLHVVHLQYGKLPVSARLTLDTDTPETTRIMGSHGVIEIVENALNYVPQRGIDTAPSYYSNSFPQPMRQEYDAKWHAENDAKVAAVSFSQTTSYREHSDDDRNHLANFFNSVRTRKPVVEDVVFGHHAAAACHMANISYFKGSAVSYEYAKQNRLA